MAQENIDELHRQIKELESKVAYLNAQLKQENRFGLQWIDVPEAFDAESENKIPILEEVPELAITNDDGKPTHILIEGDNYHALTCLNYTHHGKVDVIYIDPPYNTGSDGFTYKDKRFLEKFPDGAELPINHPLRHSAWLSFMDKRLRLAKDLLSPNGIMFISIDDNEQANLRLLCEDIFGNKCVEQYIWCLQDKSEGSFVKTAGLTVRKEHEYILCCMKNASTRFSRYKGKRNFENGGFSNPDNDTRGDWFSGNISRNGIKSTTGSKYYTIVNPAGIAFTRNWTLSKEEYEEALRDNRIYFANNGKGVPRLKIFANAEIELIQSSLFNDVHTSITGKNELKAIFGGEAPFAFPKPTTLIQRLLSITKPHVVLDFFAGSGTTMHAVMLHNRIESKNMQCILVTNNENNICQEVTYVRNKRVIKGYKYNKECVAPLGNSLKYYRTSFVGSNASSQATDEDKTILAQKAGCLLALAENTLYEQKTTNNYQIFKDKDKDVWTAVYFKEDVRPKFFNEFVDEVKELKGQKNVYIFSWGDVGSFESYFGDDPHAHIKGIPQPILDIYKSLNS
ncbi:MAG: site-specific DNA-methyltransferase [Prevotella sp.]|nr:site-specific DNA-methyltransferase [Candidatus Equicola faecalis]